MIKLLFSALVSISILCAPAQASANLIYRLEFHSNHPLRLRFSLENKTGETIYILPWNTPLEDVKIGKSLAVTCNGEAVDFIGFMIKRSPPGVQDFVAIEPGLSLSSIFLLKEGYRILDHGACVIAFRGGLSVMRNIGTPKQRSEFIFSIEGKSATVHLD